MVLVANMNLHKEDIHPFGIHGISELSSSIGFWMPV